MKEIKRLPDGELEIMQAIWSLEAPMQRQEIERCLDTNKHLAPTTILTFLARLGEKGFIEIRKEGRTNYYLPLISQKEYLASESRSILNKLFGGSISNFATSLCDSGISKEEIEELREMLERGTL